MKPSLHRPEPILHPSKRAVDRATSRREAAEYLRDGGDVMVADRYSTGVAILGQLKTLMRPPADDASYGARQDFKRTFRTAAMRLQAPIANHRVALEGVPHIGFLAQLYPDLPTFALPFVEVQELHGAWELHDEGVHMAVLGHKIHPFYGTYAPTRVTHLELFATWLSQHEGSRDRAIDVGTGCGVLALMLAKAGFGSILATDSNPNAIESVARELTRREAPLPITATCCDLFGSDSTPADLIVFNPPWMQGEPVGLIDGALYFEPGLFTSFFEEAATRLTEGGRLVLLFSNLIELVQPDVPHPIKAELEGGRFHLVTKTQRKVKAPRNQSGQRRWTKEKVEVWELAKA
jgi:hypothetical protein